MRKIAVCDDESIIRQQLILFLRHLEEECGDTFEITSYSSGEEVLEKLPEDTQILLLDIKMKGISGMDTARKLRENNRELCIIFITTMTQCALEGYDVHAFGFIAKPLQYEVFRRQMLDALGVLTQQTGIPLALKANDQVVIYHTNDILYFEVYGRVLNVVTSTERREFLMPLKKIEEQVAGQGFFRVHKSYLVNCRHVKKICPNSLVMSNGQEVTLSKHRRNDFLREFSRYVRGPL